VSRELNSPTHPLTIRITELAERQVEVGIKLCENLRDIKHTFQNTVASKDEVMKIRRIEESKIRRK